jgi:NADPH:quinone reductase-like Zn-dependent oxidoreductase
MIVSKNMKAVVCQQYGPPEVLHLEEVKKPIPGKNEILIKVKATAVNSGDVRIRKADPWLIRLFFGFFKPRKKILGMIISGEVVAIGENVKSFQVGDQVFGSTGLRFGAYAEFVCLPSKNILILKPTEITHEEAACLPFGGITAIHFLRKAGIKKNQKVLIYGASGASGTAAIQLAKYFGAVVTGFTSSANINLVKSLGADEVIDYKKEEVTENGKQYDIIFDAVGKTSFSKCKKALAPGGKFVTVKKGLARTKIADLELLSVLTATGKYIAVIDKIYSLQQMVEAHQHVDTGHKKGNVIIRME